MILVLSVCVTVIFAVSVYMLLGGELKGIAMGVFLLSHAANLSIIAMSGSPVGKAPPLLSEVHAGEPALQQIVDPLPQALILTAIVIGFAVMGFLLSLIVVTGRSTETLDINELANEGKPTPSTPH